MALLEVKDLRISYETGGGRLAAVGGVSFEVSEGETLAVVGESGAGKSSLSLGLMRLLPRNALSPEGRVFLDGVECLSLSEEEFRKQVRWKKLSMVFQGAMDSLHPVRRVGDQIAEPLLLDGRTDKTAAFGRVAELLSLARLPTDISRRYPHELSGGMKQRVMIAMALACSPKLVILDEPTSALDVIIQAQIMNLLKQLKRDLKLGSLFVTHDLALASDLADRIAVMYAGEFVEIGTAEQVLGSPRHPYTKKLLGSIPSLYDDRRPEFIPGTPPKMTSPPAGCYFSPRCPEACELCSTHPELIVCGTGQHARCHLVIES
ncbi:oligopeptide/dipeptide ABC transporter, ATP-binding protein, C-terminal domain [Dehalogenimonas alkenigignens]|uniref:Oligopeptide/dipeptide ABC transporter, ATP-binding protein, C-terminal domain n=1 Tax=Dehalogenimonas alkenigignens TaxID=1217799 RepID=A0A0W0GKT2_9CHLR|nr:ABC transporter ATP-binding protein [Dehalogenimonas alkenigignens]KTB49153.1 oligopeptide/dipeptide ABC transporter, ATP-binding protein, C-terminal domain [Dehalogenimonas alkenigignens]